ncbi:FecCD family ABC transporter permease [Janibacter sp. Soil728]|uniref:FecCD family ABC transporter permease n=1 Tax=Janibacter sp. Soil728 TaxID=1736393 RepID=UPI000ACF1F9E|nr:iron ABC transporter permease [Janibacter sp. Soil728]
MSHDRPGGRRLPTAPLVLTLLVATAASAVVSLALGSEPLAVSGVIDVLQARLTGGRGGDPSYDTIVWELRAPRVLMALVVGAGLSLAGACMQTLVRNPLADPYLLGVSSGAGVGATLVIVLGALSGFGIWALSLGALGGALLATALVFGISLAQGGITPLRLVLTGVVMSAAFSSVSSFLVFFSADPRATQSVLFWLLGSLSGAVWAQVLPSVIAVSLAVAVLMALHSWLDALAAGPEVAASLGVPVAGLRITLFVLVSVLVGVLVAVSGGIGFVGLVVPHLARIVVGARHRCVLPVAAVGGALFMLWVDVAARVVVRPQEIPLSVVTGLIGAPIFLALLGRRHYTYSGGEG